jgi:uncharacterized protein with HEPN domain
MLPDHLKLQFPTIPWREISGFRNILVHNYLGDIDALTVQAVVSQQVPKLIDCVRHMLAADGAPNL